MQENEVKENQTNLLDKLYTPKQIAERGILSLVTQWKSRNEGILKFYQSGRKIFYSESHIADYLAWCEVEAEKKIDRKNQSKMEISRIRQTGKSSL